MRNLIFASAALILSVAAEASTTSYVCKFTTVASPKGLGKETLELRYVLDPITEKAYLIGNAGSSEVKAIPNADGISFIEITDSGNVMVTAITSAGDAVHSRNGIMSETLIPTQFYGKCVKQ